MSSPRFDEWVSRFEDKAGERFCVLPGFKLWVGPDNSFISYKIEGDTFWIGQAVGCGLRWKQFVQAIAEDKGCKYIKTYTFRDPRAFCRKWGTRVTDTTDFNGRLCYTLMLEVCDL